MGFLDSVFDFIGDIFDFFFGWLIPDQEIDNAITIERQGSDQAIPVLYGENKVGAIKVHKFVTDTPEEADNDLLHIIAVFCEGEIEELGELFFNGVSENDSKFSGGRLDGKWYKAYKYNGAAGQPASAAAVSGIPNWTINHKLDGLAYIYLVLQLPHEEQVWRGEPQVQAVIKGKRVYDPRTGTTAYSTNPALCLRDYILNPIYGGGEDTVFPNDASFEWVANLCEQGTTNTITKTEYIRDPDPTAPPIPVTTTETVTLPRFSCNLLIDTDNDYMTNIRKILSSFRGIVQDMTSSAKITSETTIEETYGSGTTFEDVYNFNADRIVEDDGLDVDSGSISDRYNRVEIRFRNKEKNYEKDSVFYPADDAPIYTQWLNEDGGKKQDGSFELDSITDKHQAIQMAEVLAKKSRFTRSVGLTGMPETIVVEVGDIVTVDSPMMGWIKKPFRVESKELQSDDTVKFNMREHEDAVYPWSGATFDELVGGTWLGDPNNLYAPANLAITPDPTLATTGRLTWTYGDNAFVRRYEVKVTSGSNVVFDVDVLGRSWTIPLLDVGSYVVEVYAISTSGARSPSAALSFTLTLPVAPIINTVVKDWEVTVRPYLAGIGLGTTFEHDIVAGDGAGYTPQSVGRAVSFTHGGLLPNTLYTVFTRTINAYGTSDWVSLSVTTTENGDQIEPYLDGIRDQLDNVELIVDDGWNPAREVSELVTSIFNEHTLTEDNRATLNIAQEAGATADGNLLAINAIEGVINDPATGLGATFAIAQQASVDTQGNAESITAIYSGVTGEEDKAAALIKLNSYLSNGGLGARAFIGTDVNDRVTGIVIDDSGTEQRIEFISDSVAFVDATGTLKIYYDLSEDEYFFDGIINAVGGNFAGTITSFDGVIGGWSIQQDFMTSASSGQRIELDASESRISIFDTTNEKVVMGYLDGLPKNDGSGNWGASNYGFWARAGDDLTIDGTIDHVSGDFIVENDASIVIRDAADNVIVRLGSAAGAKGTFIYNAVGDMIAEFSTFRIRAGGVAEYLEWTAANGLEVVGGITADRGEIGGWAISGTSLTSGDTSLNSSTETLTLGANVKISPTAVNFGTGLTWSQTTGLEVDGKVTATSGEIGNWEITSDRLRSATSGARIELNPSANRVSIFDSVNEKVAMGYLSGLPKYDGSGNWSSNDYGFWARSGDNLVIDGDVEYNNGDWVIENDASIRIRDGVSNNEIMRWGTDAGVKGMFIYDATTQDGSASNRIAEYSANKIRVGSSTQYMEWTPAGGLKISGDLVAASGTFSGNLSAAGGTFTGDLDAAGGTFTGALSAATGTFTGTVSGGGFEGGYITIGGINDDNFVVDYMGNITQAGGYYRTAVDTSPQPRVLIDGRPWAGGGSTAGRYALWIGTGTTTAGTPLFYVDKAGNGFIKGEFFQGQIIETRYGTASGSFPITATISSSHNSVGNPVELTGTISQNLVMSGDTSGQASIIQLTFKRGGTTVSTVQFQAIGFYNSGVNQTRYVISTSFTAIDSGNSSSALTYSVDATSLSGPTGTVVSQSNSCSIKTFENKFG